MTLRDIPDMMVHHSTIPYEPHEPINLAYPEALAVWIPSEHGDVPSRPDSGLRGATSSALHAWHGRSGKEQKTFPESEVGSLLEKISKSGKILR